MPKISFFLDYALKCFAFDIYIPSGKNILQNNDMENTNMVNDDDVRSRRYTEKHHSVNINVKEISFNIFRAIYGDKNIFNSADKIRPPSNPTMGNIFKIPSAAEDSKKRLFVILVPYMG